MGMTAHHIGPTTKPNRDLKYARGAEIARREYSIGGGRVWLGMVCHRALECLVLYQVGLCIGQPPGGQTPRGPRPPGPHMDDDDDGASLSPPRVFLSDP